MSVCIVIAILLFVCNGTSVTVRGPSGQWIAALTAVMWGMALASLVFALLVLERGWP